MIKNEQGDETKNIGGRSGELVLNEAASFERLINEQS